MNDFQGFPTAVLENQAIRLEYLTTTGPRIVRLSYKGSDNLLGDIPDITWDTPYGKYFIRGGHRLWIAPELPEKTYAPESPHLEVKEIPAGVILAGRAETGSGVRKSIRIELEADRPVVRLTHSIVNENTVPITFAPWVITMFRQGGTVILPQPVGNADPHGLLHNRLLVLWPYLRLSDPRLTLRDDFILVKAQPALPPVKLGYANKAGWMAYWLDGILFCKRIEAVQPVRSYPDAGCNAETYCNDRFVELESLGMLSTLEPGLEVQLTETWELYPDLNVPFIPDGLRDLLEQ
jgi:hypothetical protein